MVGLTFPKGAAAASLSGCGRLFHLGLGELSLGATETRDHASCQDRSFRCDAGLWSRPPSRQTESDPRRRAYWWMNAVPNLTGAVAGRCLTTGLASFALEGCGTSALAVLISPPNRDAAQWVCPIDGCPEPGGSGNPKRSCFLCPLSLTHFRSSCCPSR